MSALIERLADLLHPEPEHEGWEAHPEQWDALLTGQATQPIPCNTGHARAVAAVSLPAARTRRWLNAGPTTTGGTR